MIYKKALLLVFYLYVTSFSQISKGDDVLPVELIYFFAETYPDSVFLKWGTATELSNYGFELQRSNPENVTSWDALGFVFGHGTSYVVNHYTFGDTTAENNNTYYYRLKQIDNDGMFKYSDTVIVNYVSSIRHEANSIAGDFFISQNYPNPFNPSTTINVSLRERGEIVLRVYDLPGNLIYEKNYGEQFAGKYKITIDAKNWSSGVYIYQIITGEYVSSKPMILLK